MNSYLQKVSDLISKRVHELIVPSTKEDKIIHEAALYSLTSSAKRLRPALVMASCEMFDIDPKIALDPALSLELIHTYSLIHDDLPCMDDDDFRRGKPSLHKAFGEDIAVLTGDFLLTFAFEILAKANQIGDKIKTQLIYTLAKRSGLQGMIGGQAIDLSYEGKKIDEKTLHTMHYKKTASLFIAALEFGALIGNGSEKELALLEELGQMLGLAYQVQDDILDATSTAEILGKPAGSDVLNKKATFVSFYGTEKAKTLVKELQKKSIFILNGFDRPRAALEQLCTKLLQRKPLH